MFKNRLNVVVVAMILYFLMPGIGRADWANIQAKSKSLTHYIMGVYNELNDNSQQAVVDYQQSIKFAASEPMPRLRLAAYYVRMGRMEEAARQLKIVIKSKPESTNAHYLLAMIYSSQKKYVQAAAEYEIILKLASSNNPDSFEIHAYLAQLYYSQRKYPQTIQQLEAILAIQPKNVSSLFLLGSVYLDLENHTKAKEYFKRALVIDPNHDGTLNSLAYIYAQEESNLDDALKMARKAVDLDPSNGAYHDTLGWVLFKMGFNADGLMSLEKALTYTDEPIVYEHIGDVYKVVKEFALARKYWLKSLSINPDQPKLSEKISELNKASAKIQNVVDSLPVK